MTAGLTDSGDTIRSIPGSDTGMQKHVVNLSVSPQGTWKHGRRGKCARLEKAHIDDVA